MVVSSLLRFVWGWYNIPFVGLSAGFPSFTRLWFVFLWMLGNLGDLGSASVVVSLWFGFGAVLGVGVCDLQFGFGFLGFLVSWAWQRLFGWVCHQFGLGWFFGFVLRVFCGLRGFVGTGGSGLGFF